MYALYNKEINESWTVVNLLRYKNSGLTDPTDLATLKTFSNGRLQDPNSEPHLSHSYRDTRSNQLRNELRFLYSPSTKFNMIAALDVRSSIIQAGYVTLAMDNVKPDGITAEEHGTPPPDSVVGGSNHVQTTDLGAYAQGNYFFNEKWKITAGLRLDYHEARGFSYQVLNPRLAIIYTPDTWVLKAIYAEAFMNPSNFERYGTLPPNRPYNNPDLAPEKVFNYEFSARKYVGKKLDVEAVMYYAIYTDAIEENLGDRFINAGQREIFGIQLNSTYKLKKWRTYLNYTFTSPKTWSITDNTWYRIADIANHMFNVGLTYQIQDHFYATYRGNFVGTRQNAAEIEQSTESQFKPYMIHNLVVTYGFLENRLRLQFAVYNIFDKEYFSPGVRSATGNFSTRLPQNDRNFRLSLIASF